MSTRGLEALTVEDMVEDAGETAKLKGWDDEGWNRPTQIALMHSELSEALEDLRNPDLDPNTIYFLNKKTGERSVVPRPGFEKPIGVPIELADVVIRIAHYCHKEGIDLEYALRVKMQYNETRPHRHGGKQF